MNSFIEKHSALAAILLCLVIGSVFLVLGIFATQKSLEMTGSGQVITGQVMGLESRRDDGGAAMYYPKVSFNDQTGHSIEFVSSGGSNPPSYREGDIVSVLYNPSNPQDATINDFSNLWLGPIMFLFFGGGAVLAGLIIVGFVVSKKKRRKWLSTNGTDITASITDCDIDESFSANGRHPYVINAEWQNPQDGKMYLFESDPIWFNPTEHLTQKNVRVRINPQNPKVYQMDISFLPEVAA